jgi:hypothetical protein
MDVYPPDDLEEDSEGEDDVVWEQFEDAGGAFLWKLNPSFNDTSLSRVDPKFRQYVNRDDKHVRLTQKQLGDAFIEDQATRKYLNDNAKTVRGSATIHVLYISAACRPLVEKKTYPYASEGLAYRSWDGSPGLAISGNPVTRSKARSILDLGWDKFFVNGVKAESNYKPTRYVDPELDIKLFARFGLKAVGITDDVFKQLVADTIKATSPKQNVEVVPQRPGQGWVFVRADYPFK